jgi:hypothetical protein
MLAIAAINLLATGLGPNGNSLSSIFSSNSKEPGKIKASRGILQVVACMPGHFIRSRNSLLPRGSREKWIEDLLEVARHPSTQPP